MSYTAKVIAVLGRTLRAGRWKLADESLVIAVFGRCVLDLSRAYVDEDDEELEMSIFALFGSVSVILPPGCDVEPSGIALLASSEVEIPSDKGDDITQDVLAPLDISWFAMFGRVRINELVIPSVEETVAAETPDAAEPASVDANPSGEAPAPAAGSPQPTGEAEASAAEVEAEQAALRDEIAQWRSETGRAEPDAADEIDPESEIEDDAPVAEPEDAA